MNLRRQFACGDFFASADLFFCPNKAKISYFCLIREAKIPEAPDHAVTKPRTTPSFYLERKQMLRKIRIVVAAIFFVCITLLFLDFTGTLHAWLGWMAKIQFLPALLALHVGIVVGLVVLTLLFGRVYCSVICPLGVMQDVVSWISGRRRKHRNRFRYSRALTWLRYTMLVVFVALMFAGFGTLLAPYSAYGRIVSSLLAPVWQGVNNLLAAVAERLDSYAFYTVDVWVKSLSTLIVAVVTFVVIAFLAWRHGRTWCNTVCPVGTVLGFLSRYSLFRPVIDATKCVDCKRCAHNCKASCIDIANHRIDYSRCVACMDCLEMCHKDAIHYTRRRAATPASSAAKRAPVADSSRRKFLGVAGLLAWSGLRAQEKKVDGGLAVIVDKKIPQRATPLVPPGAGSLHHFLAHCTACQLCVSVCPNEVLRPSGNLERLMKPEMSYERGYCRPECTKCSEVCPTGAIRLTDLTEKASTQIGHAVWTRENCVVVRDGVQCTNCKRHCPTGAIMMVPLDPGKADSLRIPTVNEELCIGCGACENLCPARPFSALHVEGHERHRLI